MALLNNIARTVLPQAPTTYDPQFENSLAQALNNYIRAQNTPGAIGGTSLNLSHLPTSAAGQRSGTVWVDTTNGNVLKIVP